MKSQNSNNGNHSILVFIFGLCLLSLWSCAAVRRHSSQQHCVQAKKEIRAAEEYDEGKRCVGSRS